MGLGLLAAQVSAEETLVLKTQKDKVSYAIGVDLAKNLKQPGIEVDVDLLIRGLKDGLSGEKLLMTDDELRKTMNAFQNALRLKQAELRKNQAKARAIAAEDNKKEGDLFLAENKTKEGVVAQPSGLQYKILKAGDGKKPTEVDTVECRYRGTLIDGTEFDSSYRAGNPGNFKVKEVIPGWKEALTLMPVGSKWQLFIPPSSLTVSGDWVIRSGRTQRSSLSWSSWPSSEPNLGFGMQNSESNCNMGGKLEFPPLKRGMKGIYGSL